jgi:FemAB-related protein (PEP-CTERM system-associated)
MPSVPGRARRATSLAFCNYGDVLVAPSVSPDAVRQACLSFLRGHGIVHVEVRELCTDARDSTEIALFLDLPGSTEELWNAVGGKVRNQVRKAQRAGLSVRWGVDQVDVLYDVYAANMGRLGTPVHGRRFFHEIVRQLGDRSDVLTVGTPGQVMGAMLVVKQGTCWADPFASTLSAFNHHNPNMLLYWEALRSATDSGATRFDFGRSHAGSGTDRFKRQWGAQPRALRYRTYVDAEPVGGSSTSLYRGDSARLASRVWQRLPGRLQLALGPRVRRWMP